MKTTNLFATFHLMFIALAFFGCKKDVTQPVLWAPLKTDPNLSGFQKVIFSSEQIGWVSGGIYSAPTGSSIYPILLKTTDGGVVWTQVDLRPYQVGQFITMTSVDQNILYACGTDLTTTIGVNRRIYKSTDGGVTWAKLTSTGFTGSFDLHFFNEQVGLSAGTDVIQKTTDGGQTWRTTYNAGGIGGIDKLRFITPMNGFAAGGLFYDRVNTGTLLHTLDGGETWQSIAWPYGAITQIDFVNVTVGYIGTVKGNLYKTTNGGQTWQLLSTPVPGGSTQTFLSEQEAYVGGEHGLWHTQNAGDTWQTEYPLTGGGNGVNSLCFPSPHIGYAVTAEGLILKRSVN